MFLGFLYVGVGFEFILNKSNKIFDDEKSFAEIFKFINN